MKKFHGISAAAINKSYIYDILDELANYIGILPESGYVDVEMVRKNLLEIKKVAENAYENARGGPSMDNSLSPKEIADLYRAAGRIETFCSRFK